MSYNRYKKIINMYTLSYSHSLHANTGSKGSTRRAGGPGYPKPIWDFHGTPRVSQPGPGPRSLPRAGEGDGGTELSPQCCWAGCPCGRCFMREGTSQQPQEPWLCPPAPWEALQGEIPGSSTDFEVPRAAGVMLSAGVLPFLGVASTPQHQADPHSDLTCFSSIIHILESPGRNYRKLRLFQTLSARQVKSSHTKQGNQNLQH